MKHRRLSLSAPVLVALATALAASSTSRPAHAAKEIGLGVTYDPRIPIGGLRDFTPGVAFAGVQAKWDFFPLDGLSIGLEAQYHLFQQGIETKTTPIANGAVTAATFRYASIWSFLPTARYYFSTGTFQPYAALGAGLSTTTGAIIVSDLTQRDQGVSFVVQPSVGVLWRLWSASASGAAGAEAPPRSGFTRTPLESMFGLTASLTYAFTTADVPGATNISYAGVQLGVYAKP